MKVALVNSCKYLGGAELWQMRFARFLKAQGEEVCFFVRAGKFAELLEKENFLLQKVSMKFDLDPVGIWQLFSGFRKFKPEVVIFNDQRELRLGIIPAQLAGVSVKVQRKGWSYLKGSFRDRFYYAFVDYVIVVSREIEKMFQEKLKLPQEKIFYLPNGVNTARFAQRNKIHHLDSGEVVIGMAGRLEKQKRQSDLLKAGKILIERGHNIRLNFAGEGREREKLAQEAEALGIVERVNWLGFMEKIEEFLAELDLFVFCSEWEGMPNAVLEAMAAGKPVIAADIPGVREIIEDGKSGLLYPAGNYDFLAKKIAQLLSEPLLAEKLGQEAQKRVQENFAEQKIFQQLHKWLKDKLKE